MPDATDYALDFSKYFLMSGMFFLEIPVLTQENKQQPLSFIWKVVSQLLLLQIKKCLVSKFIYIYYIYICWKQ